MSDIQRLYDQRRELIANEVELKRKNDNNEVTSADFNQEFDRMESDLQALDNKIRIAEREEDAQRHTAQQQQQQPTDNRTSKEIYGQETFYKFLQVGCDPNKLPEADRKIYDEVHARADLGTGSGGGDFLVPEELVQEIITAEKFMGGVRPVADVMPTRDGRPMPTPFNDSTTESGEQVNENPSSDTSQLNPKYSEKNMNAFLFSSKEIVISKSLLQDSAFDMQREFRRIFSRRFFNVLNPLFTTGSGSGEPEGIVTGSSITQTAQSSASLVREDFINLIHKVDRAYRTNGAFQFTDEIMASIRKLEVGSSDSRPLYQPTANAGEPDRVEGFPVFVNNDLGSLASANKVATFGDHSLYRIRDVQDAEMMRLDELHAKRNQVGFLMFRRHDARLSDANAVGVLQMK